EDADHAEHQPVAVEDFSPFGEISGGEDLVEDLDQLQRACVAVLLGGEAGIGDKLLVAEAARQCWPLPILVEQRQDQPEAVLALIVIGYGVQRALAWTPFA